jgi:hypothetical protein
MALQESSGQGESLQRKQQQTSSSIKQQQEPPKVEGGSKAKGWTSVPCST